MTALCAPALADLTEENLRRPVPSPEELAQQRESILDSLLQQLSTARDEETAKRLEHAIWQLWMRSGSPTVDVLMQQAMKAVNGGRTDAALGILDSVVELAPDYAEGWNRRATVLYLRREFDASLRDIARTLELEPRHFGALSGMGLIKRATGDDKGALAAFRQALKIHPFLPAARDGVRALTEKVEGHDI